MNTERDTEKRGFWQRFGRHEEFVCENWRPGEVCHPHKHIPVWERFCVAVLGASLVTAPPILNRFAVETAEGFEAIANVVFGGAAVFTLAWVLSGQAGPRADWRGPCRWMSATKGPRPCPSRETPPVRFHVYSPRRRPQASFLTTPRGKAPTAKRSCWNSRNFEFP